MPGKRPIGKLRAPLPIYPVTIQGERHALPPFFIQFSAGQHNDRQYSHNSTMAKVSNSQYFNRAFAIA
jgi:hypothetical protein